MVGRRCNLDRYKQSAGRKNRHANHANPPDVYPALARPTLLLRQALWRRQYVSVFLVPFFTFEFLVVRLARHVSRVGIGRG